MFSRFWKRATALVLVACMLSGCAEINKRGGVIAEIEDAVLFTAHTKSHRLFRSYMLIGVLLAAARHGQHNDVDRASIEGNLRLALSVAYEAYECLYSDAAGAAHQRILDTTVVTELPALPPSSTPPVSTVATQAKDIGTFKAADFKEPMICQFFDEKMARLDYALYRLALNALFNQKASAQLSVLRDKLVGEIPVLSPAVKSAIFAAKATNQATTIVDDLLNLSFESLGPIITLLPLYRDALEMNMWVIVDALTKHCDGPKQIEVDNQGRPVPHYAMNCETREYARYILGNGSGQLPAWRDFVWKMNYSGTAIEAYAPHFILVSRFIWRSCSSHFGPARCQSLITEAMATAIQQSIALTVDFGTHVKPRTYSASVRGPSRFARERLTPLPGTASNPPRDPDPTGSIKPPAAPPPPAPPR